MYKILEPIQVGPMQLRNRVMYLAMAKGLSTPDNFITDRQIAYYENYAKNHVGLIVTGACITFPDYPSKLPMQPGIYDDKFIPGMKKLVDAVHSHGSKFLFQPWHPGITAYGCDATEVKAVADFSLEEIKELQNTFVQGAIRAQKAGADGVEVHIAHNYLLEQFLTPLFNKRTDEYGAQNMENGLRFTTELIGMIKKACGAGFAVTTKINGNDFNPEGMTAEKVAKAGPILEAAGADMISVSAGGGLTNILGMSADGRSPEGWKVPLAEAVKKSGVKIPVMATGSLRHPEYVEQVLAEGRCDMIGMGRGLLAEPEWVVKLEQGREREMHHCISCMHCMNPVLPGVSGCTVNPLALRELEDIVLKEDGKERKVAIAGGGPAGLEAAVTLAKRGFVPVIFEKKPEVGGMELIGSVPDGKSKLKWHIEYFRNEVERLGIQVNAGKEADGDDIAALDPYAVFVCTGSNPVIPGSIPGIKLPNVKEVRDILADFPEGKGKQVVIVGAGLVGLECGATYASRGNKVTIIDMLPPSDPAATSTEQMLAMGHAMAAGIDIRMKHKLLEITQDAVKAENLETGESVSIPADEVVLSMGVSANNGLYNTIKDRFDRIYNIGDSDKTGLIAEAVQSAFDTAAALD